MCGGFLSKDRQDLFCFQRCPHTQCSFRTAQCVGERFRSGAAPDEVPSDLESVRIAFTCGSLGEELCDPAVQVLSRRTRDVIVRLRPNQLIPKLELTADLPEQTLLR